MKTLLVLIFFLSISLVNGQTTAAKDTSHTKSKPLVEHVNPPLTEGDLIKYVVVPLVVIVIQFIVYLIQTGLKRRDDQLSLQLNRLDKQINNLYGPLYSLYHIGNKHYSSFLRQNHHFKFVYPGYIVWLTEVFMKTNISLEATIANNADLFIGGTPKVCIDFCQHVAALKTCIADITNKSAISCEELDERMTYHPHPLFEMQAYVIAAFVILKKEQQRLLSEPLPLLVSYYQKYTGKNYSENPRRLVSEPNLFKIILKEWSYVYKFLTVDNDSNERENRLYAYLTTQGLNPQLK